jgi:hypothetical protein
MVAARCDTVSSMDADAALSAHLRGLEERLLDPGVRRSRAALEELLAVDFAEIGRSGRRYDRAAIVATLADEVPLTVQIDELAVRLVAGDVALVTYRTIASDPGGARSAARRSSIWRREPDGAWRMVFHQGTPAA